MWCDNEHLYCIDCPDIYPCGWDNENSFYNCSGDGADPSGQNPIDCPD